MGYGMPKDNNTISSMDIVAPIIWPGKELATLMAANILGMAE